MTITFCWAGEDLHVTAKITNLSNRSVKPKFVLDQKKTYNGGENIKVDKLDILREKADTFESWSGTKTVRKVLTIPRELPPSILVCPLIKLEYRLKVSLTTISIYILQIFMYSVRPK